MSDYGHTHVMADLADWGVQRVAYYRELERLATQADRLAVLLRWLTVAVIANAVAGIILVLWLVAA